MPIYPKHFSIKELPINNEMKIFWEENGFLIIDNFYTNTECDELINRSSYLINNFDYSKNKSIFNTNKQNEVIDNYFINSGDKIRFFFEEGAFDKNGNFTNSVDFLINKKIIVYYQLFLISYLFDCLQIHHCNY